MSQLSHSPRYTSLAFGAAALLALAGTGCGNWVKAGVVNTAAAGSYKPISSNYTNPLGNGGFPGDSGYRCSSQAQVATTDGADPYVICPGETNAFQISVHGTPTTANAMVCVFPADVVSATEAYPSSDASGNSLYRCVDASSGTVHVEFTGARFNAAFVVKAADQANMAWCLKNAAYEACPGYSYQRFAAYDTGSPANASH